MKKALKIIAIIVLAACVYSFVPVVWLYIKKAPIPYTNGQVVKKLEEKKGEYFGFIILGDNHAGLISDDSSTLKLIRNMNRETRFRKIPIDFAAIVGDLTFRGTEWDYTVYNKLRSLFRYPVISAAGNHDDDYGGHPRFEKCVGEDEFSFVDRNSYFIVINNIIGTITDEQFSRIEQDLIKSSSYKHRFIIMHKPPISPYQQSWYRPELNRWAYRFMKLCEKYKVDIVFAGHEHMFNEKVFGGVKYVVSGGGGGMILLPDNGGGFLHYLVVRVYGDYVDYEVRKIQPPLWEFFTYYMWKDIIYFLKSAII